MAETPHWAKGSAEYARRDATAPVDPGARRRALGATAQYELTGITWDAAAVEVNRIVLSAPERARARFRASLPNLIWNAAALEGNTFTLPEVQTLLEGVTVGGKPVEDAEQVLALSEAYSRLGERLADGSFGLTRACEGELHLLVAQHEALDAGAFRGEGSARGGGSVSLSSGGTAPGRDHGEGGVLLSEAFDHLVEFVEDRAGDPRLGALVYFAAATRHQFHFDGNKRTARLMMSGLLMRAGYDAVNIPFARRLEFNQALDALFTTDDATLLLAFLVDCA